MLLFTKFLCLAVGDQGVRDISKGDLDRLMIKEHSFLLLGFRKTNVGSKSPPSKDGLSESRTKNPKSRRASEQCSERRTLISRIRGQRDLRKIQRSGHSDLGIRGNQLLFCLSDIGAPF